jgi:hypothetical protein
MCGNAHDAFLTDLSLDMHGPGEFPGVFAAGLQILFGGLAGGGDWRLQCASPDFLTYLP